MRRIFLCAVAALLAFAASAQELNVGSVNVRYLTPKDNKKHNGWDERKGYLCDMINHEAFDVFGAQEVTKTQLDDMLAAMPRYRYIGVARDEGAEKGEFSPVFYRKDKLKMLDGGTFWLSETPDVPSKGWDAAQRRICSWGYFQRKSDKTRFYFLSVHLDHRGKVAKLESAKLIVNWIKENCHGENVVVVGDFNVNQHSKAYSVISKSGILKDCHEVAKYRFALNGTFNAFDPKRYTTYRIDHIFVTNDIEVSRHGVLTYHYFRDMNGNLQAMDTAAPKEVKGENREVKCVTDHYSLQSFLTLKKSDATESKKR